MAAIVTPDNFGSEFDFGTIVPNKIKLRVGKGLAVNQFDRVCLIGGVVNANGSLARSSGLPMTSARLSTGLYQITFLEPPGSTGYAIFLSLQRPDNSDDYSIYYMNVLTESFSVEIRRQDNGAAAGAFKDNSFSFLVIV